MGDHLPAVRLVYVWRTPGTDNLVTRYIRERGLQFDFVANWKAEILDKVCAAEVVVFDGGDKESDELISGARSKGVPVRIVDVRKFVTPAYR